MRIAFLVSPVCVNVCVYGACTGPNSPPLFTSPLRSHATPSLILGTDGCGRCLCCVCACVCVAVYVRVCVCVCICVFAHVCPAWLAADGCLAVCCASCAQDAGRKWKGEGKAEPRPIPSQRFPGMHMTPGQLVKVSRQCLWPPLSDILAINTEVQQDGKEY